MTVYSDTMHLDTLLFFPLIGDEHLVYNNECVNNIAICETLLPLIKAIRKLEKRGRKCVDETQYSL